MATPVIFRKFKEGDLIALFPTIPADMDMGHCQSYQHVGQHGAADLGIIYETKPAPLYEYTGLLLELISIGYDDLKVYQRCQRWMDTVRFNATRSYSLAKCDSCDHEIPDLEICYDVGGKTYCQHCPLPEDA